MCSKNLDNFHELKTFFNALLKFKAAVQCDGVTWRPGWKQCAKELGMQKGKIKIIHFDSLKLDF